YGRRHTRIGRAATGVGGVPLPGPVHLLRRRRAASAGLADRSAARREGDRYLGRCVPGLEVRYEARLARAVQFGLLQECALQAYEVARRGRGQHLTARRRPRAPEAGHWRPVDAAPLYGPGSAQPPVRRRRATRERGAKQRLLT